MKRLFVSAFVIGWGLTLAGSVQADDEVAPPHPEERPAIELQNDIPMAYLLGTGQFEATVSFPEANGTIDPFDNRGTTLTDGLNPSLGNAGYPTSLSGKSVRVILGTGESVNFLANIGRDNVSYQLGDLEYDYQMYGVRISLTPESQERPASTIEYDYKLENGRNELGSQVHRLALNLSKQLSSKFTIHGAFAVQRGSISSLYPQSPPPQEGLPVGALGYQQGALEADLALTWNAGQNTDVSLVYEHFGINREIDEVIPGGGIQNPTRVFLEIAHAVQQNVVLSLKFDRESNQFLEMYPFMYGQGSYNSFNEPFGWVEFGVSYRANLSGRR